MRTSTRGPIPPGWERFSMDVNTEDVRAWKVAASSRDLTLREWLRGTLNLAAGIPPRRTGRRKKTGHTPLDDLRLPTSVELGSVGVLAGAPACRHVEPGGYCNRCGVVRGP